MRALVCLSIYLHVHVCVGFNCVFGSPSLVYLLVGCYSWVNEQKAIELSSVETGNLASWGVVRDYVSLFESCAVKCGRGSVRGFAL